MKVILEVKGYFRMAISYETANRPLEVKQHLNVSHDWQLRGLCDINRSILIGGRRVKYLFENQNNH